MAERSGHFGLPLAALGGLFYYLGFSPLSWWPLTFLGATMLAGLLDSSESAGAAVSRAALWKTVALVPTGTYLSGIGLGVHLTGAAVHIGCWAALGWCYWGARRRQGRLAGLLVLPCLWTLAEWLGVVEHFLPSHMPCWSHALWEPALRLAPHVGVYGVSTLAVLAAVAPWAARLVLNAGAGETPAARVLAACAYAGLLLPPLFGRALYGPAPSEAVGRSMNVTIVSLGAEDKMTIYLRNVRRETGPQEEHLRRRTTLLRELLRGRTCDLVVLPFAAIPVGPAEPRSPAAFERFGIEEDGALVEGYRDLAKGAGSPLAASLRTRRGGRAYISTILIGKDGSLAGLRDKWKLTTASETWPRLWLPFRFLLAGSNDTIDPAHQFTPGAAPFAFLTTDPWPIGALICLEGHMPSMYLGFRQAGARLVLLLANANWFNWEPGTFNIQLLRTVRLSAAAYGIPVVLTGKAGYSAAIAADGSARVWPWISEEGKGEAYTAAVAAAPPGLTLAARWGEYYLPLSAALAVSLLGLAALLRRRQAP